MPKESNQKIKLELEIIVAVGLLVLAVGFLWFGRDNRDHLPTATIGNSTFYLDVSDEPQERTLGLSGRDSIDDEEAMLFIFDDPATYGIWMKDMNFSIDILWLNLDREVIHIEQGVSPNSYPKVFYPNVDAKYVLETAAGATAENRIELGQVVNFDLRQ